MVRRKARRGLLVAIEGGDGAGKSTLQRYLISRLRKRGYRVLGRREPNDPELGRYAQQASVRDPWSGAVYFSLDRYRARPTLERDLRRSNIVISDRSLYSTLAYQGSALAKPLRAHLEEMQALATILPDRVILLDLPPTEALRRLRGRGRARSPLERRRTLERVRRAYRRLARQRDWLTLDARRSRRLLAEAAERYLVDSALAPATRRRRRPS
ncbi:MAG: dTMP kinase [Thermoplasmata archaeon]